MTTRELADRVVCDCAEGAHMTSKPKHTPGPWVYWSMRGQKAGMSHEIQRRTHQSFA
jgi:hypothetical protein